MLLKQLKKRQTGKFLGMVLDTLGLSLFGNMLTAKGIIRAGFGKKNEKVKEGQQIVKAVYGFKMNF